MKTGTEAEICPSPSALQSPPEAWEEEPACMGQAARKSEGMQLPFSFSRQAVLRESL